jgi:hypothetical protein
MAIDESVTGPINIVNPSEFSILQLASMVVEMTGSRSRVIHMPLSQDDPQQRRPHISRAQDLLSWQPRTEGLIHTIAYFEKLLSDNSVRDSLLAEMPKQQRKNIRAKQLFARNFEPSVGNQSHAERGAPRPDTGNGQDRVYFLLGRMRLAQESRIASLQPYFCRKAITFSRAI